MNNSVNGLNIAKLVLSCDGIGRLTAHPRGSSPQTMVDGRLWERTREELENTHFDRGSYCGRMEGFLRYIGDSSAVVSTLEEDGRYVQRRVDKKAIEESMTKPGDKIVLHIGQVDGHYTVVADFTPYESPMRLDIGTRKRRS